MTKIKSEVVETRTLFQGKAFDLRIDKEKDITWLVMRMIDEELGVKTKKAKWS